MDRYRQGEAKKPEYRNRDVGRCRSTWKEGCVGIEVAIMVNPEKEVLIVWTRKRIEAFVGVLEQEAIYIERTLLSRRLTDLYLLWSPCGKPERAETEVVGWGCD